ncbi:DUF645 family protein (plasmid) [Rhizobium leguminosarum]|nr:DUF645 family protein [Rhizobium leguminosarum]TAX04621.1 DUF645 family protein [Rhizobium leguminosarum]TAX90259.1 DUF645 family protein [Rhizobium leguminosarum]TAY06052.1 DUF645 family protein [Rhizobium leguminosarum]TAY08644.1 DUF645 family protein [Rhizobium leguminosarum]
MNHNVRLQRILPFIYQIFCFLASNLISGMLLCQPSCDFNHTNMDFRKNCLITVIWMPLSATRTGKNRDI